MGYCGNGQAASLGTSPRHGQARETSKVPVALSAFRRMRCLPRRSGLETLLARAASQTKARALDPEGSRQRLKAYMARECPGNGLRLARLKKGDDSPKRKDTPAHILRGCGHRKCRHTMAKGAPEGAKGVAEDAATTVLRLHVRASLGIGQAGSLA